MSSEVDNTNVLDVELEELPEDLQTLVTQATEQYKARCMLAFSKNKSGKVIQKQMLPTVLLPGQTPQPDEAAKKLIYEAAYKAVVEDLTKQNTTFLNNFRQLMVTTFGPVAEKIFEQALANNKGSLMTDKSRQPEPSTQGNLGVTPDQGDGEKTVMVNQEQKPFTYGMATFGVSPDIPGSAFKVAPTMNRLHRDTFGSGYHPFTDGSTIDAMPNPGYKSVSETQAGQPNLTIQGSSVDVLVHRMAEMMQSRFGLKPKNNTYSYMAPYPEWYNRVAVPAKVKIPTEFTKFSGQDDTSTVEHISRYLVQLGEASAEEAFRIRYFPMSLTGPAFTWYTALPPGSIGNWMDLEQKFHSYFYTGTSEKKLVDLTSLRMKSTETPQEYLRRFRETKNMCFSLNIPDDQLPGLCIHGMLPNIQEKLFGLEFDDLGQLAQRLAAMSSSS